MDHLPQPDAFFGKKKNITLSFMCFLAPFIELN